MGISGLNDVEYRKQLLYRIGAEHCDARVAEVGDALEERRCCQMTPDVEDAAMLAQALDAVFYLLAQDVKPFAEPLQWRNAGWVANRWCELLPITLAAKQRLMELEEPSMRLQLVDEFLRSRQVLNS